MQTKQKRADMVRVGNHAPSSTNSGEFCAEYRNILHQELKNLPSHGSEILKEVKDSRNDILDVVAFKLGALTDKVEHIEKLLKTSNSLIELDLVDAKVLWEDHKDEYQKIHKSIDDLKGHMVNAVQDIRVNQYKISKGMEGDMNALKSISYALIVMSMMNVILTIWGLGG